MRKLKTQGVLYWVAFISWLAMGWAGCAKAGVNSTTTSALTSAYVELMNMAPFSPAANIFVNSAVATSAVNPGNYTTTYEPLIPGNYDISFNNAANDTVLADIPISAYDSASFHTLILYNADTVQKKVTAIKVTDDFSQVTANYAYYRFFHLSPSLPPVDLYLNNMLVQPGRASADITQTGSAYVLFEPLAGNTYNITVNKAGTDTAIAYLQSNDLSAGSVYTIFLCGVPNDPSFPVTIGVLKAAY